MDDGNSRDTFLAVFLQRCSAIRLRSELAFRKMTATMEDIIGVVCIPEYNRNLPSDTTLRRAQSEFDAIYVGLIAGKQLLKPCGWKWAILNPCSVFMHLGLR